MEIDHGQNTMDTGFGGMTAVYELRAYLAGSAACRGQLLPKSAPRSTCRSRATAKEPPYDDWHASAGRDKSGAALPRPFAGMQPL